MVTVSSSPSSSPAPVTPRLAAAVEAAYGVFAGYRIEGELIVCDCAVCVSEADARFLAATPVREIPARRLAEYTNSAHGYDPLVEKQVKHFLPRYLDLVAQRDVPDSLGLDICLRRIGGAGWREDWPAVEAAALEEFFDAFTEASLTDISLAHWPVGWRLGWDMVDVLTFTVTAGGDLERVLATWDAAPDPAAALHVAGLRHTLGTGADGPRLGSPYLETDWPGADRRIAEWALEERWTERIVETAGMLDDPRYEDVLGPAVF